jgi:hypothetical protein
LISVRAIAAELGVHKRTVLLAKQKIKPIICFKIKNPPTLHSTSKIQPTTWPTFVFSVFANVGKSGVMKENC